MGWSLPAVAPVLRPQGTAHITGMRPADGMFHVKPRVGVLEKLRSGAGIRLLAPRSSHLHPSPFDWWERIRLPRAVPLQCRSPGEGAAPLRPRGSSVPRETAPPACTSAPNGLRRATPRGAQPRVQRSAAQRNRRSITEPLSTRRPRQSHGPGRGGPVASPEDADAGGSSRRPSTAPPHPDPSRVMSKRTGLRTRDSADAAPHRVIPTVDNTVRSGAAVLPARTPPVCTHTEKRMSMHIYA